MHVIVMKYVKRMDEVHQYMNVLLCGVAKFNVDSCRCIWQLKGCTSVKTKIVFMDDDNLEVVIQKFILYESYPIVYKSSLPFGPMGNHGNQAYCTN